MAQLSAVAAYVVLSAFCSLSYQCIENLSKNHGEVYPQNKVVYEGSNVTFMCVLNQETLDDNYTTSDIIWHLDSYKVNNSIYAINQTHNALVLINVTIAATGTYFCGIPPKNSPDKLWYVCSGNLSVGRPPSPPENISIVSDHLLNLIITWTVKNPYINTYYDLIYRFLSNTSYRCPYQNCSIVEADHHKRSEYFSCYCIINGTNFFPSLSCQFMIQANNSINLTKFSEYIIDPAHYVQPRAPSNLTVISSNSSTINVYWVLSFKYTTPFALSYEVFFAPTIRSFGSYQVVNTSNDSVVLEGLFPNMKYNIKVRAKPPFNTSYYSPFAETTCTTLGDVPQTAPIILPGMFTNVNLDSLRTVTIFWKDLDPNWYGSSSIDYSVDFERENTIEIPAVVTGTHIKQQLSLAAYNVTIRAVNVHGSARQSSSIYIPASNKILENIKLDFFLRLKNPGRLNLTWFPLSPMSNVINVTVYWCHDGTDDISLCNWIFLPREETSWELEVNSNKYKVGTSVESISSSSGLNWWTSCKADETDFPELLKLITDIMATSIKFSLVASCHSESVIKNYIIEYCELYKCTDNMIQNFIVPKTSKGFILENLKPFTIYNISIYSTLFRGEKYLRKHDTIQTLESKPGDSPKNIKIINTSPYNYQILWDPPTQPNGKIDFYQVFEYNHLIDSTIYLFYNFNNLTGNKLYNFSVKACVKNDMCSGFSNISIKTNASILDPVQGFEVSSNSDGKEVHLKWKKMNSDIKGPVDCYVIFEEWEENDIPTKQNFTVSAEESSYELNISCSDTERKYRFSVAAAQQCSNGELVIGKRSEERPFTFCGMKQVDSTLIIGGIVGGSLLVLLLILVICGRTLCKRIREHLKIPEINLPNGIMQNPDDDLFDISFKNTPIEKKKNDYENLRSHCPLIDSEGKKIKDTFIDYGHQVSCLSMTSSGIGSGDQNSISSHHSHVSSDSGAVVDGEKVEENPPQWIDSFPISISPEMNPPYIAKDDILFTSNVSKNINPLCHKNFYKPESMPCVNKVTEYSQITLNPRNSRSTYFLKSPKKLYFSHKSHSYPKLGPTELIDKETISQSYVPSSTNFHTKSYTQLVPVKNDIDFTDTSQIDSYVQIGESKAEEFEPEDVHIVNSCVLNTAVTEEEQPPHEEPSQGSSNKSPAQLNYFKNDLNKILYTSKSSVKEEDCISDNYSIVSMLNIDELNAKPLSVLNEKHNQPQVNNSNSDNRKVLDCESIMHKPLLPNGYNEINKLEVGFLPGGINGYVTLPT